MEQAGAGPTELAAVVERARRRVLVNRALGEAGVAATVTLLGPTLFLLLGKEWVGWTALLGFLLAGIAAAAWRMQRLRPDLYRVAQVLDARAASEDQISTAVYFRDSQEQRAIEQRRAAARLASRADVESAFPFGMPRSVYALASVFAVASALCALRFLLEKPLRVDQPLARVVLQALGVAPVNAARRQEALDQAHQPVPKTAEAIALENQGRAGEQTPQGAPQSPDPDASGSPNAADKARSPDAEKDGRGQNQDAQADEFGEAMASNAQNDPIQSYEDMMNRDAKSGLSKAEGNQAKDSNGKEDRNGSQDASNSLLAKLRDAMNNMLSRMQQKPSGAGNQQQSAGAASNSGDEQQEGSGEGRNGAGQPKAGGKEGAEGENAESGAQDMSAQNSSGQGGKSSDQGSRGQSGDGAGRQEGDKRILESQRQEAMGKLSDLYGKRAANVTGEITIETQGGKQTLRTPQGQSQARHADSGGEVSRDEIPLAYQAYVKEYFNKLRQSPQSTKR